jgi:predicted metal-dependent peptidase
VAFLFAEPNMSIQEPIDHETAMLRAKVALMKRPDSAFFTTLAFNLKHEFDTQIRTACTDGRRVRYNPQFFMSLNKEEQIFLILHEVMHCALMHMDRGKTFDPMRYNIAADHVINLTLIERGFTMPACGLADPKYTGMSAEEIYKLLPEDAKDDDGFGVDLEESGVPDEKLREEIQNILIQAAIQSKINEDKAGTIPAEIQIFLNKLLNPKLPWNKILAKYLHSFSKNDFTFKRPNRRFFPDHYLPSMYSENLDRIAIAVDTSGSVSDEDFLGFISETHSILRMMNPKEITFIQFDHGIRAIDSVKSVRDLMGLKFTGRGGTEITEVLGWANTHKPQLLLVFTDGYFDFEDASTRVPTIWLIHGNPEWESPFGKTIHYEL